MKQATSKAVVAGKILLIAYSMQVPFLVHASVLRKRRLVPPKRRLTEHVLIFVFVSRQLKLFPCDETSSSTTSNRVACIYDYHIFGGPNRAVHFKAETIRNTLRLFGNISLEYPVYLLVWPSETAEVKVRPISGF
jgi:hypothetical protein